MGRKSLFLCFICLMIILPTNVSANLSSSEPLINPQDPASEQVNSSQPQDPTTEQASQPQDSQTLTNNVEEPQVSTSQETTVIEPEQPIIESQTASPSDAGAATGMQPADMDSNKVTDDQTEQSITEADQNSSYSIGDVTFKKIAGIPGEDYRIGDILEVTADVIADEEIDDVFTRFYNVQQDYYELIMRYDSALNKYIGYLVITSTFAPGDWTAIVFGRDGNLGYVQKEIADPVLKVVNDGWSNVGPKISECTVSSAVVNAGEEVTFSAKIEGVGSDVALAKAYVSYIGYVPMAYDESQGKWIGKLMVPDNFSDNITFYISVDAYDQNGNETYNGSETSFLYRNLNGDYMPPQVDTDSVEVTPSTAVVGDQVTVRVKVTDDKSGVDSVTFYVDDYMYDVYRHFTKMEKDPNNEDWWTGSFTIDSLDRNGEYEILLDVADKRGNREEEIDTWSYITVDNSNEDFMSPHITDVVVSPQTANVGDVVKISAKVEDEESDILMVRGYLSVRRTSYSLTAFAAWDRIEYVPMYYNAATGMYEGTYTVQPYDSGIRYAKVEAIDTSYNIGNSNDHGVPFNINNPNGDNAPPMVDYVKVTPNKVTPNDLAHLEAKIYDDVSGVKSVTLYIQDFTAIDLQYDEVANVWKGDYMFPSFTSGERPWFLLRMVDNAGNEYWENVYLDVINNTLKPDVSPPIGGLVSEIPEMVLIGNTITFKANFSDQDSGVKGASVYLSLEDNPFGGLEADKEIKLTYNEAEGLWVGSYTVQPSDHPGFYWIEYYAEDNAFNQMDGWPLQSVLFTGEFYESPFYKVALDDFNKEDYYKAVDNAGKAILEGDIRPEVQDLMNKAAQALLNSAEKLAKTEAENAYQLLISTVGVPDSIKETARVRLALLTDNVPGTGDNGNTDNSLTPTPVSNSSVTQPHVTVNNSSVVSPLPVTATNYYNLLLAGLALVVIGGAGILFGRKKERQC